MEKIKFIKSFAWSAMSDSLKLPSYCYLYEKDSAILLDYWIENIKFSKDKEKIKSNFVCNGEHDYVEQVEKLLKIGIKNVNIVFDKSLSTESIFKLSRLKKDFCNELNTYYSLEKIPYCSANINDNLLFNNGCSYVNAPDTKAKYFINANKTMMLRYRGIVFLANTGKSLKLIDSSEIAKSAKSIILKNEKVC